MRAREVVGGAVAVVLAAAIPLAASLAGNAATEAARWPGVLDVLRRHPWASLAVMLVLTGALLALDRRREAASARPAPPPSVVPPPPAWLVDREETERAVEAVLAGNAGTVGLTTGLQGAGGFGKTTLAKAVCADERVRRRFPTVVFVTLGGDLRGGPRIAAKAAEVIRLVTGEEALFHEDPALAGAQLGRALDGLRGPLMLVLDDVWSEAQLAPFLVGGRNCVRLVTTRIPAALPDDASRVLVDRMTDDQARAVLTTGLDLTDAQVAALLAVTGGWPLLLRLVNRLLAAETATGLTTADACAQTLDLLRAAGPAGADLGSGAHPLGLDDPAEREKAVRATVEASVRLLSESAGERERLLELGVFAEDEVIPVELVCALWRESAGYEPVRSRALCRRLRDVALVGLTDSGGLVLHDVIRDYLRAELGAGRLTAAHGHLVAGVRPAPAPTPWWELGEGYLHDRLVRHLVEAGLTDEAEALVGDLRWVELRLRQRDASAPFNDARLVPTAAAERRASELSAVGHLLAPEDGWAGRAAVLYSRLGGQRHWAEQAEERAALLPGPVLVNQGPPPDLSGTSVVRVLPTEGPAMGVGLSPDGRTVTTVDGGYVRRWDVESGRVLWERRSTMRHTVREGVRQIGKNYALSADGRWFVHVYDGSALVWEVTTGNERVAACPFDFLIAVAISPDGEWVAFCSVDEVTVSPVQEASRSDHPAESPRRVGRPEGWVRHLTVTSGGAVTVIHMERDLLVHDWRTTDEDGAPTVLSLENDRLAAAAGDFLAYAIDDEVRLRDLLTGAERSRPYGLSAGQLAVSPDGVSLYAHTASISSLYPPSVSGGWRELRADEGAVRFHEDEGQTSEIAVNGHGRMARGVRGGVAVSDAVAGVYGAEPRALTRVHTAEMAGGTTLVVWIPWRCDRWAPESSSTSQRPGFGVATPRAVEDLPLDWQSSSKVSLVRTGAGGTVPLVGFGPAAGSVSWTSDGTLVALAYDGVVEVRQAATGEVVFGTRAHWLPPDGPLLALAPDGSWVCSAWHGEPDQTQRSSQNILVKISYRDGRALVISDTARPLIDAQAWCAAAHPDPHRLLVGWSHSVALHELTNGTATATYRIFVPTDLAISPDGTWCCVVTMQGLVEILALPRLTLVTRLRTPSRFTACSLTPAPDGFLVHADSDRGVHTYLFRPGPPAPHRPEG
ncbi:MULTISPECIES: NB-ARC domain-containing protein [unclassified Streptomyces]|uniref:NB-ARC domain-containing protein n=1 Tax=unclassified Streptomyces TaxID=2593676 RepID=UPI00039C3BB9|nr:NB-ARC domain-containing protein [Streptomyces sp. LaPpAH-202]MYW59213.1 NB-ARC domain protein [Streptomyces sp. SID8370]MYW87023.1 NB-ARC domain protein [Streptomyces sp. SID8371]